MESQDMTSLRETTAVADTGSRADADDLAMGETSALRAVMKHAEGCPVVFSTGYLCRRAQAIQDSPNHFYMTGSMGLALAIAAGIAAGLPPSRPVVAIDGDGSWLMNPANAVLIGTCGLVNVHHIVLDNGSYMSTGGQPTVSGQVDFAAAAHALSFGGVATVNNCRELDERLTAAFSAPVASSTFTHCRVRPVPGAPGGRLMLPLDQVRDRFQSWISTVAHQG
jgi:thiamine pyrophosphate-dependent acetolactate synthase large subunit-like protein